MPVTAGSATEARSSTARWSRDAALLAVVVATAVALALRWIGLDQSLFGDEQLTRYATADGVGGVLGRLGRFEQNPPLYFWLAAAARHLGAVEWLRLPSLLASVAAVPLTYALGRLTAGVRPGVFAAWMVALSPFLAFYGTEARPYALMTSLLLASAVCLLVAIERGGAWWWAGMVVASAAALYTQYVSVFWLAGQGAWALWVAPGRRRPLTISYACVAVVFLPWLPSFLDQSELLTLVEAITARSALRTVVQLGFGHPFLSLGDALGGVGRLALAAFALALAAGAVLAGVRAWRGRRHSRARDGRARAIALLLLLAVATPAGLWAYAHLGGLSFGLGRYWVATAPPAFLLAGALLAELPRPLAVAAALAALGAAGTVAVRTMDGAFQRPQARAAAAAADAFAGPGVPVVEVAPLARVIQRISWMFDPGQTLRAQGLLATRAFQKSPQAEAYATYYRRPHARYGPLSYRPGAPPVVPVADPRAWRRAAATGRAVVLSPIAPGRFEAPAPPPGLGARLVARHVFPGFADLVADEYVFPRRRAGG